MTLDSRLRAWFALLVILFLGATSPASGIVSDDFSSDSLDSGPWTFVNPLSDGQVELDGTRALISVPFGVSHDMWGPSFASPRIMQDAEDTDFEVEVKFESVPSSGYQMQGLIDVGLARAVGPDDHVESSQLGPELSQRAVVLDLDTGAGHRFARSGRYRAAQCRRRSAVDAADIEDLAARGLQSVLDVASRTADLQH